MTVSGDDIEPCILFIIIASKSYWIVNKSWDIGFKFTTKQELKKFWVRYKMYFWFLLGFYNNNTGNLFRYAENCDARQFEQGITSYLWG